MAGPKRLPAAATLFGGKWMSRRLAAVVLPAGMAVLTWLVGLTLVAYAVGMESVTVPGLLRGLFLGLLVWPIVAFAPWRGGLASRLRRWAREKLSVILVSAALASLAVVGWPAVLMAVLWFPLDVVGLYGLAAVVSNGVGPAAAAGLMAFARTGLILAWLYLMGTVLVTLVGAVGGVRQ
jgi:hypothetical protein